MIKRQSSAQESILGLDVLRGVAVILMLITHGFRLFLKSETLPDNSFLERILYFFALIEPYTSALFLFLVGIGVFLSFHRRGQGSSIWIKQNFQKAFQLYILGVGLFFIEYGWQYPDIIFSPSILSVIALAMVLLTLAVQIKFGLILGLGLSFGLTLVTQGLPLSGINAGPGGAFPLVMFSFLGYLVFKMIKDKPKMLNFLMLVGLLSWIYPYGASQEWVLHYQSSYRVFLEGLNGWAFLKSGGTGNIIEVHNFWNHSLISVLRIGLILIISLKICLKIQNLGSKIWSQGLALIGRHALGCYILHLLVIAIFDLLNWYPQNPVQAWGFILLLVGLCGGYSYFKESAKVSIKA